MARGPTKGPSPPPVLDRDSSWSVGLVHGDTCAPTPAVPIVARQVDKSRDQGEPIDYLTFVPDGEHTLDRQLGAAIELLRPLDIATERAFLSTPISATGRGEPLARGRRRMPKPDPSKPWIPGDQTCC
jgi:hypothetical protein